MSKRETLLARSERIIGKSLSEDTDKPALKPKRSLARRREQVLEAQRTHRHRTQQYIRELEKEVLRLREENNLLLERDQRRVSQLRNLKAKLVENDILINFEAEDRQPEPQSPETSASVQIDLTWLSKVIPQGSCENHPAEIAPPVYQVPGHNPQRNRPTPATRIDTETGITFILKLEEPCMGHVKHAHMGYSTGTTPEGIDYNSGPGHLLNASTTIICSHATKKPAEGVMTLTESDVERLLDASARLQLDNEITPVQMWERICDAATRRPQMPIDISKLTDECSKYVYCNSFGAVMQKSTAMAILADLFVRNEDDHPGA